MFNDGKLLHLTKSEWEATPEAFRGRFIDFWGRHPELRGRKTLLPPLGDASGHYTTTLLVEGVGFVIDKEA